MPSRRFSGDRRSLTGCLGVLLLTLTLTSLADSAEPSTRLVSLSASRSPIKHVVIIYQENHSFDEVLGVVCKRRKVGCNGYSGRVTFAHGATAPNIVEPDIVPVVSHVPSAQLLAAQNAWNKLPGCRRQPHICVTHHRPRSIPNLAALATRFAVSSATFASSDTASFGAHITLAAGTMNGFVGKNPHYASGVPHQRGWGCGSNRVVRWSPRRGRPVLVPSCVPDRKGDGPFRQSPVRYTPTIMQRMEQRGLSWHIYQGLTNPEPITNLWSICDYFFWCGDHRLRPAYDSRTPEFVQAARGGDLAALSILLPLGDYSQHNTSSMKIGDNYIGRMVRAVQNGPQWKSTAIFITYDDCGCFYDHVDPPGKLGIRAPMVIVSPWARHGSTDRETAVLPYSMLAFVERNFRLAPLSRHVTNAYDYRGSFNYRKPVMRRVMMTRSRVSDRELKRLARMPSVRDDPT